MSRSEAQRWIAAGRVTIDGRAGSASDVVRAGARVEAEPLEAPRTDLAPDASVPFEVLHVDAALVVLVKPAGVVVHPAPGAETGTLVHGLIARGFFSEGLDHAVRPGIVHRLDKGTSGVMVVARTPVAREALKKQFAEHTIDREYVAICVGRAKTATYRTLHGRDPHNRQRFTSRVKSGKVAVTHVELLETFEVDGPAEGGPSQRRSVASLVRATLETGRTHQIRMHLSEAKTPVLGDALYGKRSKEIEHQALHARLLGFVHPATGERVRFEAPPPADFQRVLDQLRESRSRR